MSGPSFHGPIDGHNVLAGISVSGGGTLNAYFNQLDKGHLPCDPSLLDLVKPGLLLEEKEACLHSLGFRNINARRQDIPPAHPNTCEWLLQTEEFRMWHARDELASHRGVLWIKGKPGAGKSTLMKHIYSHCLQNLEEDRLVATYFFNARGEDLEKTPLGMFRSLLHQLLSNDHAMYERFVPLFRENQKYGTWEWREAELREFLLSEIEGCQSKLLFLIDALDECSDPEVEKVVSFLELLTAKAVHAGVTLDICLSSRHYPNVSMDRSLELDVDCSDEHDEDIQLYIQDKLKKRNLDMEAKLFEKAQGVFMWAVLVTAMLNRAFDRGQVEAMEEIVDQVPSGIEEVFQALLKDVSTETILMLQWLLFTRRPLRPEELYFAVMARTAKHRLRAWDEQEVTVDDIRRRIIDSSRGLIEIRQNLEHVQFIHLSVHEFLLRQQRLHRLSPELESNPIGISHSILKDGCMSYLMAKALRVPNNKSEATDIRWSHPFLDYAATYVLEHSEEAQTRGIEQREFLAALLDKEGPFERLRAFHECSSTVPGEGCTTGATILHMASFHGHKGLAKALLETGAEVDALGGVYGTALQAALAGGNDEIVGLLLKSNANVNAQGGVYGNALQAASAHGHHKTVKLLLESGARVNAQGGRHGTATKAALRGGYAAIVAMLVGAGADIHSQGGRYGSLLQEAAEYGYKGIVAVLLEKGANVNARGGEFDTALQAASRHGRLDIVRVLLEEGADIHARGGIYGDALQAASESGSGSVVGVLLEHGADVNAQGGIYGNALQAAVENGNTEGVRQLIKYGVDLGAAATCGSPLQAALQGGHVSIMIMLLEKGVRLNVYNEFYNSALQKAIRLFSQDGSVLRLFGKALQAASAKGDENTVWRLLKVGANANGQGGVYGNALQAASATGNEKIAKMLLKRGANITAQGGVYGNALQAASANGHEKLLRFLLDEWISQPTVKNHGATNYWGEVCWSGLIVIICVSYLLDTLLK
ncbi:ankyrin repeat-containing domain protein [Thelonectria olida]|uniref:Ankyrin repeat-containing domain protein n=1 Tax=Thelonectria olida TaxID=1576542 RepID=A0A9P8VVT3_9HYPO|nr:ankyrin repeat-containing domain protein [Thelonectria olida]